MKTFDQSPWVFASHEPETSLPRDLRQRLAQTDDLSTARDFARALFAARGLRAMRKRPIMRKAFRSGAAHAVRTGYMYALSGVGRAIPALDKRICDIPVPDFASLDRASLVVKSVAQQADVARIAESAPEIKVIYVIRHPCGQVFSMMNGLASGQMNPVQPPPTQAMAALYGLSPDAIPAPDTLSQVELLARRWAVYTDINYRRAATISNMRIVTYEALCADPLGAFEDLFAWAGVDWHADCAAFLEQSLGASGDGEAYHALVRNPLVAANKWRTEMSAEDAQTVRRLCGYSATAELFEDL